MAYCAVLAAACSDLTAPGLIELQRNRAIWEAQGLHSYTLNRTDGCFCPYSGQLVAVRVENDVVASVRLVSTGEEISHIGQTVPEIFDQIQSLLDASDLSVRVEYEESVGIPTRIEVRCPPNALDCGSVTTIRLVPQLLGV